MTELLIAILVAAAILVPQIYAVAAWQGWWRRLAAAPLLVLGADILLILIQTSYDPTSHNLWPLELAMIAIVGLLVAACCGSCAAPGGEALSRRAPLLDA